MPAIPHAYRVILKRLPYFAHDEGLIQAKSKTSIWKCYPYGRRQTAYACFAYPFSKIPREFRPFYPQG